MQISHIEYFLEIARCKSINQAAKNLFVNQSSLSASLATLENELGFKLFTRLRQGVVLTPEGEKILNDAHNIIEMISHWQTIPQEKATISGTVRIFSQPLITTYVIMDVLNELRSKYPLISLNITDTHGKTFFEALLNNNATIGLGYYTPEDYEFIYDQAKLYNFDTEIVYFDELLLFFNKNPPLSGKPIIESEDLKDYHFIVYNKQNNLVHPETIKYFKPDVISLPKSSDMLYAISLMPDLAGLFSKLMLKELYYSNRNILTSKISDLSMPLVIALFYPIKQELTYAEKIVLDMIREQFRKTDI